MATTGSGKRCKILFVHPYPADQISTFVRQDLCLLREFCDVQELSLCDFAHPFRTPMTSQAMWRTVARRDLVFGWFGSCAPFVLMARVLRKPSILVGGGGDVVSVPEIGYGVPPRRTWRDSLMLSGFRAASRVLLFSESSKQSLLALPGMRHANLQTLYLGIDGDHFAPAGEKQRRALTVGFMTTVSVKRKGIQAFIEAARLVPDIPFRLSGRAMDEPAVTALISGAPANLTYLGFLDDEELLAEYRQATVYAQLSMHEGFGVALAEAMACECVPVVTRSGSIPEVVGDAGIYVDDTAPATVSAAVSQILNSDTRAMGRRARERVLDLFPIAKRREGLRRVVEEVVI
jgi:glycosyltransferase involved in cell wall biosynthesis